MSVERVIVAGNPPRPGRSVRLAWALLASLLIHLALIGDMAQLDWWPLFTPTSVMPPLEVRFSPTPADDTPHLATKQVNLHEHPRSDAMPESRIATPSPIIEHVTTIDSATEAQGDNLAHSRETSPIPTSLKPDNDRIIQQLPPSGKLVYKFYWGKSRWLAGHAVHQWVIDKNNYTLSSTVTTSGLIGLLRPIKLVETSQGIIIDDRLRPLKFSTQWNEDPPAVAIFVWDRGKFLWFRGGASFTQPLSANSFDKISYLYQLYIAPEKEIFFSPDITMGRRLEHYEIQNLGVEELDIDGTTHPAIHLKRATSAPDMENIDIWLSIASNNLPVKMTYSNQSGDHFEQLISLESIPVK